jgi:hypothetical protein
VKGVSAKRPLIQFEFGYSQDLLALQQALLQRPQSCHNFLLGYKNIRATGTLNMIRTGLFLVAMTLASATSAFADCKEDIAKIDAAMTTKQLDADQKAQVEDMRSQAVQLCGAGNEEEGTAVTSEVIAMLGIE